MTIGELWDKLAQYPDDVEVYIGFINGHSIDHETFEVIETIDFNGKTTISLMIEDIAIINN
jgi:hypothetical protein